MSAGPAEEAGDACSGRATASDCSSPHWSRPFANPSGTVGQLVDREGRIHRVTRWVELRPVHLERGGSVRQWEVWGRPVSDRELREELDGAAERLLSEE